MPAPAKVAQVGYVRKEIVDLKPRYDIVRDCVAGQEKIKAAGKIYLPIPNEADASEANKLRYTQYKERAVFYGVTGRTLQGMVGTVFQKTPELEIPDTLDILKEDADGGGVGLNQQAKKALSYVLQFGRAGLLVDYPPQAAPATLAQLKAGDVRPNITLWQPWDVINWRVSTVGGKKVLSLVVISEQWVSDDDGFSAEEKAQYRVLKMMGGVYRVELWRESEDGKQFDMVEEFSPLDGSGKPWPFIPFTFIGSENNDENPDLPPLYDLAALNIAHYRNSADYEEACYMLGQPTPWASGLSKDWVDDVMKGTIALGSRGLIPLPPGGQVGILQVQPNTMPKEAMEHKEKQMVALGAKLVEQRDVRQTATEASQNEASETSVLATSANNVSSAYVDALKWANAFVATSAFEVVYKLNTEFEKRLATAQDRAQLVAEWQANAITTTEMRAALTKVGVATLDLPAFQAEIDSAGPDLGMPVNAADVAAKEAAAEAARKAAANPPAPTPAKK